MEIPEVVGGSAGTTVSLGQMCIDDCRAYNDKEEDILAGLQDNVCAIYKYMFELKKRQRTAAGGEDHEILEHDKSKFSVFLPKNSTEDGGENWIVLPREKPIPKEKQLTKWERFRLEKGIAAKGKRSRMIYDEVSKDWVPRFGMGSAKKIAERHNWVMEERKKHVDAGLDPFTYKKNEKNLEKEKQNLRELKN